jgi:hypothetical protein
MDSDNDIDDPSKWSQKEKDQYRFGGIRYSFRGPEYPAVAVPQIKGLYAYPTNDSEESSSSED